jgi:hypothetical protein
MPLAGDPMGVSSKPQEVILTGFLCLYFCVVKVRLPLASALAKQGLLMVMCNSRGVNVDERHCGFGAYKVLCILYTKRMMAMIIVHWPEIPQG